MSDVTKKVLTIEIDVESGEVKNFEKQIETLGQKFDNLTKKAAEINEELKLTTDPKRIAFLKKELAKVNDELGDTAKSTEKAKKGVGGLAGGFKKVGLAMKAAGIGLVIALLATLKEVFGENQAVVDTFSTAMTGLKIAFNDFFKFVSGNLSTVTGFFKKIFDDPLGSIKDLGDAIKENIIERFNSLLDTLGYAGDALKKFFEGDFNGAIESAKQAGKELVDVYTGVNNSFDRAVDFVSEAASAIVDYTTETWKSADALTQQAKAMQFSELASRRLQLQYQKDAELQRQIRDDETKSFEERIAANERLGEILSEAAQAEQAEVQKRIDFINHQNNLLGVTQERLLEIEALRIEQLDIEERIGGIQSEQLVNRNSLLREQAEYEQSLIDARIESEKKAADEILALAKKAADEQKAIAEREASAKQSIQNTLFESLNFLTEKFGQQSEKAAKKAFQIQKSLGVAEALINTGKAVTAALTAGGNPIKLATGAQFLEAAAVASIGALQIAKIASTKFQSSNTSSGGSTNFSAPSIQPQAPQFNTVGTSGFNQLSESIAGQNEKTVKAYVVASDVSSAQSLDRNRVKQASFP
jgi:hypothetical protein